MPEMRGTFRAATPSAGLALLEGTPYFSGNDSLSVRRSQSQGTKAFCGDVLLLGHDDALQRTRASLLEQVGFRCHLARGADEVTSLAQDHFDVIVLCHTLPLVEASESAEFIRVRFPSTKVLRLARYSQADEPCFEHLSVLPSPSVFVATVQHLSLAAGCHA